MNNDLSKLIYKVCKMYDIPLTYHTIDQTIQTHPEYPSILCISDVLDSWKIKHAVLRLSLEKLQVLDIPAISCLKRRENKWYKEEYIWITQITETKVHFLNASGEAIVEDRARFEEAWAGVALAIEDISEAGEPDYKELHTKEIKDKLLKYALAGSFIALLITAIFFSCLHDSLLSLLPGLLLLLVNGAGCYLSYILIRQERNQSNRLVRKFCTAGTHIDCNQVTKSSYSQLFGLISWAEFGMAYFSAVIFWLAIAPLSANWQPPLWWLVFASLPFTVWSLFTQAFLIRKWCLFCCAIVVLLWINAGILYVCTPFAGIFLPVESVLLALLLLVCTAAVIYISKT